MNNTPQFEGRVRAAERRILDSLDAGQTVRIYDRPPRGKIGGVVEFSAAKRLALDGRAAADLEYRERINRGPRPHVRFRKVIVLRPIASPS